MKFLISTVASLVFWVIKTALTSFWEAFAGPFRMMMYEDAIRAEEMSVKDDATRFVVKSYKA